MNPTRQQRWYSKLRNDPIRWAERMEKQRRRRESDEIHQAELARALRELANLPDSVVANRYLHLPVAQCLKEVIAFKRSHIELSRNLRTKIKTL